MFSKLIKQCRNLLFPGGIAMCLALWASGDRSLSVEVTQLLPTLPWLTILLGSFISWRFNRSLL